MMPSTARLVDENVEVSYLVTLIDGPSQPKLTSYPRDQKNRTPCALFYEIFQNVVAGIRILEDGGDGCALFSGIFGGAFSSEW